MPKICVVVRKAYGAGLYAMAGPGFEPDATLALPTASIAVMGPEAAVNAVYYNKLAELPEARARRPRWSGSSASTARTSTWSGWPPTWSWTRSSTPTTSAPSCRAAWPLLQARTASSPAAGTGSRRYDLPARPAVPVRAGGQPGGDRRAGAAGLPGAGPDRDRRLLRPGRRGPARPGGGPGGGHRRVGGGRVLPGPGPAAGRGRRGRGRGRPPRVRAAQRARRLRPGGDRGRADLGGPAARGDRPDGRQAGRQAGRAGRRGRARARYHRPA